MKKIKDLYLCMPEKTWINGKMDHVSVWEGSMYKDDSSQINV